MHIVIIGNGIAGITTARHIRKLSNHSITVISSESSYFFSRTALMYVYMGHMKFKHTQPYEDWFWKKNKIDLVLDFVTSINSTERILQLKSGKTISYDKLVLALGSKPRPIAISGAKLKGVESLYSKQDLEQIEASTKNIAKAVVIGGGLIGVELAEMLHSRGIQVTMIVREKKYWNLVLPDNEAEIIGNHIISRGIELLLDTIVTSINGTNEVESVTLTNGETIECQFVGATIGVEPNINIANNTEIDTNRGILVNKYLQTNVPNIYAIGDCAEIRQPEEGRKSIEAVWYAGRMMGETLAQTLCGSDTPYNPGIWFNSAKFFDLEYQTYGNVPTHFEGEITSVFWEEEKPERSLRIVYKKSTTEVIGFNALGLRIRHEICDAWISKGKTIEYVLNNLDDLNFDPEFSKKYETKVKSQFTTIV